MESTFVMAQLQPDADPKINLEKAENAFRDAVTKYKANFLLFPETFMSHFPAGTPNEVANAVAETLDGKFVTEMLEKAKRYHVWTAFGMKQKLTEPEEHRVQNTVVMADDQGKIVRVYHKTHLYDAFGYRESDEYKPGEKLFEPIDTPFGRIGLFVCYEVRFPEVARYQKANGAQIVLMPTDWYQGDMKSFQFKTLIAARAIENTMFILACDQCGGTSLGESIAYDPMGVAIASGGEVEKLIPVYVDTDRIKEVERKLPSFKDRKPDLYMIG